MFYSFVGVFLFFSFLLVLKLPYSNYPYNYLCSLTTSVGNFSLWITAASTEYRDALNMHRCLHVFSQTIPNHLYTRAP